MKKNRLFAMLLAAVLLVCSFGVFAEEEPDVIVAGRYSVKLSDAQIAVDELIAQYETYFQQQGYTLSADQYSYLRTLALQQRGMYCVIDNILEDRGYPELTEEETDAIKAEVQTYYDETLGYIKDMYVSSYGLSEDQALIQAEEAMAQAGYSLEYMISEQIRYARSNTLYDDVTKDVTMTDDDVKAYYDTTYVAPDREQYEGNVYYYELAKNYYGTESYYVPEGYRAVSHILLTTPEDINAKLTECSDKIDAAQAIVDGFVAELGELEVTPEEGAEPVEHRSAEEIQADIDSAKADVEALEAEYAEIKAGIVPALQEKIDEIYAKIEAGEAFENLIAEYGEDPGMTSTPGGYEVHKESVVWVPEFRDGAMALEAIGDVSEPVVSDYGVHIIKYLADVPGGAVALSEEAFADMREEALSSKKDEAFYAAYAEWEAQYPMTINEELISLPAAQTAAEGN